MKTEYAWVIQRDDGKYLQDVYDFEKYLTNAIWFLRKGTAELHIKQCEMTNCKVVKVKIEVCDEEN